MKFSRTRSARREMKAERLVRSRPRGERELDDGAVARREAALAGVVGGEEIAAAGEVVLAHHPRAVEAGGVGEGQRAEDGAPGELAGVLAHRRGAGGGAVVAEAVGAGVLAGEEGLAALARRRDEGDGARGVEHPVARAQEGAAVGGAEVEAGAAGDGEVALARVEGALEHAHAVDRLGDHEVEVGVALAVDVGHLVDGHPPDGELHVLAVLRVEAAEEDLVRLAVAPVLREEKARGPASGTPPRSTAAPRAACGHRRCSPTGPGAGPRRAPSPSPPPGEGGAAVGARARPRP